MKHKSKPRIQLEGNISHWFCSACEVSNLTSSITCRNCHKPRWEQLGFTLKQSVALKDRINGRSA